MKKFLTTIIILSAFHSNNFAQSSIAGKDKFFLAWEVGIPANDFLSHKSYSGGKIGYQKMVSSNFSVGLSGSWNSFEQYVPKTTYQKADGSGALTSDIVKQVYSLPLTLNAQYYFKGGKDLLPFVGVGLGGQYSQQTLYFNIYSIQDDTWGFVARPEAGLMYYFNNHHSAMYISGTYNYAANKSDVLKTDNLSHVAIALGVVLTK